MIAMTTPTNTLPIVIVGAGIGGLAAAICLQRRGIPVRVFERVSALKPLGVGINLLPHAARVLHELDLASDLAEEGIQTARLSYYNKRGQLIWSEPRGVAAGYSVPQYSIHRGALQTILYRAATRRLGAESVVLGAEFVGVREEADAIVARFRRSESGDHFEVRGAAVIAADGIHSVARRALFPDEGLPNFARRILWRATSEGAPFLDGRTMIMAGYQHEKFVCYPISRTHEKAGRALINWIAELTVTEASPPRQDWNREVAKEKFAARFASWRFEWLNVPELIETASVVYEYPLVDRDPLPAWTHGRLTLLGDAAHPMYPIGSNGARVRSRCPRLAVCRPLPSSWHRARPILPRKIPPGRRRHRSEWAIARAARHSCSRTQ